MTDCRIVLHKEISTDSSYVPSFTLKLTVSETSDGVTPCIFVHEYIPKNPGTGRIYYDFTNVAYFDELSEVKDYVTDKRNVCLIRRSCIEKSFKSYDDLTEFLNTVVRDVQRLIQQLSTSYTTDDCETITITRDSKVTESCGHTDADSSDIEYDSDSTTTEAIVLSFDGKLTK